MKLFARNRILSALLVLIMVLSMIPVTTIAADAVTATLVTNVSDLAVGDQIVIGGAGHDFVMSTNQKTNNRGVSAMTRSGNVVTLPADAQILTVKEGNKEGTFAFYTGSGYLYAAGRSKAQGASSNQNYLKTKSTLDDNGSFAITISSAGVATITAQGENQCNLMRYNHSSSLISCYVSGQNDLSIYKLGGSTGGGGGSTVEPSEPVAQKVTIAEARAAAKDALLTVKGTVVLVDGKNVVVQDATGGINLYMTAAPTDLTVGTVVEATGKRASYNGLEQLTGVESYTKDGTDKVNFTEATIAQILADQETGALESTLVYIKNATLGGTDGSNTILSQNGSSLMLYKMPALSGIGEGDTVNVYAVIGDFKGYQLRVSDAANVELVTDVELVPISTALAGANDATFTVKGVITAKDGKNVYIQDSTGGICVRGSGYPDDYAVGDTIRATGVKTVYNAMPQLGSATYERSVGLTLEAKETTIGKLTAADVCTYVNILGVTVTEVYDNNGGWSNPNITVTDGTNSIQIYKAVIGKTEDTWDVAVGDVVDIKAAVGTNNGTLQLRNTTADEITVVPEVGDVVANLVTDATSLKTGDEIILVAPTKGAAMGPSSGNYYASVTDGVTFSDDGKTVYFYDETVQTLILGEGTSAGTWSMNAAGVYLAALAGDSNYLKNSTSVTAASSWKVEIDAAGIATIKSSDSGIAKNWIRYNASNPRFSCYASGQADVAIYKVDRPQYAKLDNEIADGDQLIIHYVKDNLVMSDVADGKKLTGISATPEKDMILVEEGMSVLTAAVDKEGYITFTNAAGKYLTSGATGNSLTFEDAASDYSLWTLKAVTGGVHIVNVNAKYNNNTQAVEIYQSLFTTFTEKDQDYYIFNLYTLTDEQPPETEMPAAGDKVVIYNLSAEGVLAAQNDTQSLNSAAAVIEDGKAKAENGAVVFTVEVNGDYYRFVNETYGYLCSNGTGNNAFYSKTASDDADWKLATQGNGYTLESRTAKFNGKYSQYLEYYSDSYKTYSMYNVTDYDIYTFQFYPLADNLTVTEGIVNSPKVTTGKLVDAYVSVPYELTFTVDAPFGVKELNALLGNDSLTVTLNGGTYYVTVPGDKVAGDKLSIQVYGVDNKDVSFRAQVEVPVKDEPIITEVTPAAASETGDNKKPTISATIANAGDEPTVTMKVNDTAVDAKLADGKLTYTPAQALADGRVSVTVTVKRADGKETAKTWSFTVGKAQYQLYFGQLHSHTTYSDGSGSLESALEYVAGLPESANVDFVAFTDHSNYFDGSSAGTTANPEAALYDMSLASTASQNLWNAYKGAIADFNNSQGNVIAIGGFEMTWSGGPGHLNTFNTPGIVSRNNTVLNNKTSDAGMKAYYALLCDAAGANSITQFNHPGSTFGTFSDFAYWDALLDTRIQLVEVGNGEGQIGAGGYYPSYEYYTMALDKGWHVAPTNNQDNHKGKWGNANNARDVVLTDDFSEEGIYQAIRDRRVYATEDKNLEIYYTVNGKQLGTVISEVPESLALSVNLYDPDATDSISKVEVIVNSGKTVHSWSDPAQLATGELTVTLDPDYSYYYIRVTQGDGDLAVTAPVWVGETLKLGISSLECGTSTPVTNEAVKLTTTLFNSESAGATVKSLTYTTDGNKVVGTDTKGYTIPANGTVSVDFDYTPTEAKLTKVTVTAVVEQDGKEYTFTMDVTLDVQDADSLVYIGIDASHYNEYVNGNYKDSMGNFGQLAAQYSVRTVTLNTSADLIAACANPKYKALILTAPSRRSPEAQAADPLKVYTDAELDAIVAFNAAGGTVILAGWSDHYENYPDVDSIKNMKAEEHMAATQNAVLEALGSSLRIGDDATYDDNFNGGQAYRLYFNTYGESFLTEGVEVDPENPHDRLYTEVFSHYGGASVYTTDGKLADGITPVVFGHSGTYSVDVDKDGLGGDAMPKYPVAEGDNRLMIMATQQLEGKGLIIVSGAAFMSNFEVQATIEDSGSEKNYSNYKICENLLAMVNPTKITPIEEVQAKTEPGYKFTIEGVVTSNASGYDKDTAFFDCIYVQDASGGICCFPVAGDFKVGDKVRVTGSTEFYQGEMELQVTSIEKIGEGEVEPQEVSAAQINDGSVIGRLIKVKGTVHSFQKENGLVQTIMVKDAKGDLCRVFIDGYITTDEDVKNLEVGNDITVVGLASYDNTFAMTRTRARAADPYFHRIRIRDRADIVCTAPVAEPNQPGSGTGSPDTGDSFQPVLVLAVMLFAGLGTAVMVLGKKKWIR